MQILRAINEVIWHQQHLRTNEPTRRQILVVTIHELALANRRERLQRLSVCWALAHAKRCNATSNGTGGNNQHFMRLLAQLRNLITQGLNGMVVNCAMFVGYRRGSNFDNDSHH
jgi:hypothetical protein